MRLHKGFLFFMVVFGMGLSIHAQGIGPQTMSKKKTVNDAVLFREDPDYLVNISEAYNHLELKDYAAAGVLVTRYLIPEGNHADAYLIMGEVFLKKKFYSQALEHFSAAEKMKDYIVNPEHVIRLYWDQVMAINRSEEIDVIDPKAATLIFDVSLETAEADKKIQGILQNLIDYTVPRTGSYYQEQRNRAQFMLGRFLFRSNPLEGMAAFQKSAQNRFLVKSVYLYLSYFFAIHDQSLIDKVYAPDKRPPPDKRRAFLLYYQNYREAVEPENNIRRSLIPDPEYEAMKYAVEKYARELR